MLRNLSAAGDKMRVAVSGHRWNKLDRSRTVQVGGQIAAALTLIGGPEATLVTGMAEGTDTLAALMRPSGWSLEAVLPLPPDRWRLHLAGQPGTVPGDVQAFDLAIVGASVIVLPHANGPDYSRLADYLTETCAGLVAVWDGKPGRPGGTADMVSRMKLQDRPVLVIW